MDTVGARRPDGHQPGHEEHVSDNQRGVAGLWGVLAQAQRRRTGERWRGSDRVGANRATGPECVDCVRGVNAGGQPAFSGAPHVDAVGDRVRSVFRWLAAWAQRLELGDSRAGQGPPRLARSSARESATRSAGTHVDPERVRHRGGLRQPGTGGRESAGSARTPQHSAGTAEGQGGDVRDCQRPSERASGN